MALWRVKGRVTEQNIKAIQTILDAAHFAAERHSHQKRKGIAAEPYVNHLIEVAQLASHALSEPDTNLIAAALLHDTIEDTDTKKEELAARFGPDVADLVAELTDDKSLEKQERKWLQIANAPKASARAQIIKMADKISNMRSILISPPLDWDYERKREYFMWAKRVVDGFTESNPMLLAEFQDTFRCFDDAVVQERHARILYCSHETSGRRELHSIRLPG